jgi:hypothetical protein
MFSLSPIPPTSPARLASAPVKGDDWCGTRPPGAPIEAPIGLPHPTAAALGHVTEGYRAMLGAHSALFPVVPMIYVPGGRPVQPNYDAALTASTRGITAIEQALEAYPAVRNEARTALESALTDARRGHAVLDMDPRLDVVRDPAAIGASFNSAANWLDVAGNLLALELGRPGFEPFATR